MLYALSLYCCNLVLLDLDRSDLWIVPWTSLFHWTCRLSNALLILIYRLLHNCLSRLFTGRNYFPSWGFWCSNDWRLSLGLFFGFERCRFILNMETKVDSWRLVVSLAHLSVVLVVVNVIEKGDPLFILPSWINASRIKYFLRQADASYFHFISA